MPLMEYIEIFWKDLTPSKQRELMAAFGDNGNLDRTPVATLPTPEYDERLLVAPEKAAAFFFSQGSERDAEIGCIGHMRFYYTPAGAFVWSLWEPHQKEPEPAVFIDEFDAVVDFLREGPLEDLSAVQRFCQEHPNARLPERYRGDSFGFCMGTQSYNYYFRLFPHAGDYSYCYCYDRDQLRQAMEEPMPMNEMEM